MRGSWAGWLGEKKQIAKRGGGTGGIGGDGEQQERRRGLFARFGGFASSGWGVKGAERWKGG